MTNSSVLLVEDNRVNQEVGRTMMEAFGCRVAVASDGHEVLDRTESDRYDIIFMDCEMPVMDGLQATRSIRQREKQQGRPRATIVALTANVSDEDRNRCLEAGMDDYLGKPFRMQDLFQMIEKWRVRVSDSNSEANPEVFQANSGLSENVAEDYLDRSYLNNIKSLGPNGPRMLAAVIGIYLNDSPILLDRLSQAFEAADLAGLAKVAHAFKSTSASLGASVLAEMCKQVESIARGNSMDGIGALISRIQSEYVKAKEALTREIEKGC
jgi:CheY-like chemotaxis protein